MRLCAILLLLLLLLLLLCSFLRAICLSKYDEIAGAIDTDIDTDIEVPPLWKLPNYLYDAVLE